MINKKNLTLLRIYANIASRADHAHFLNKFDMFPVIISVVFRKPEVDEDDEAGILTRYEEILRFDVPVNEVHAMENWG